MKQSHLFVNDMLLGTNGRSFYFYMYFFTCLDMSGKEDGVLFVRQHFKNKSTFLQKHNKMIQ